jgi:hypothetical protein
VYNKFGELHCNGEDRFHRGWKGQGHIGHFMFFRDYADSWDEAAYRIRIHNYHGWSDPIWISNGIKNSSWGGAIWSANGTAPAFLARQNCPLSLTAVSPSPDAITLNWAHAVANNGAQTVWIRKRTAISQTWTAFFTTASGISSTVNTYTWTEAEPNTEYEIRIENTSVSNAFSNITFCRTGSIGTTISRPAPSAVSGTALSTTSIVWNWTRNATDNSDVEYSLDGGSWTSLGGPTVVTITTSGLAAGSTHSIRIRNKWSSGITLSPEASSGSVTTPANPPTSTDPSGLHLISDTNSISASWTNNGGVNQTLEYKLSTSGTWTIVSLGAVSTRTITGLLSNRFYDVRVKATAGVLYVSSSTSTQQYGEDPDPFPNKSFL